MKAPVFCTEIEPDPPNTTHFRFEGGTAEDPELFIFELDYDAAQADPKWVAALYDMVIQSEHDDAQFASGAQAFVESEDPVLIAGEFNLGEFICTAVNINGWDYTLTDAGFAGATGVLYVHFEETPGTPAFRLGKIYKAHIQIEAVAPTVVSQVPLALAIDVPVAVQPTVTFSERMDPATITAATVILRTGAGAPVAQTGDPVLDGTGRIATITPAAPLVTDGQPYKIRVTTGAKDINGNAVAVQYDSSGEWYTTLAPTVASTSPANAATDVAVAVNPTVTFSEEMDPATILATSVVLLQGGAPVAQTGDPVLTVGGTVATITPAAPLELDTVYKIRVTVVVEDLAGNALAVQYEHAAGFTTVAA